MVGALYSFVLRNEGPLVATALRQLQVSLFGLSRAEGSNLNSLLSVGIFSKTDCALLIVAFDLNRALPRLISFGAAP